jgi:hypothetical protein
MAAKKTSREIVQEVRELLSGSGKSKVLQRRRQAARMVEGLRRLEATGLRYRKQTRDSVFTVTQESLCKLGPTLSVYVELQGRRVGTLVYSTTSRTPPVFISDDGPRFVWSGDRRDAERIAKYFEACASRPRSPERKAQGVLVRAMFARGKHRLLARLRPVRPAGCMMEIPVPVTASDGLGLGTGNVDVLVRAVGGPAARFVICELKRPGLKADPYRVLTQAIRYAAALDVEVNGIEGEAGIEPADASLYRKLFGATGSAKLRFGAMAAIYTDEGSAEDTVALVRDAISALSPSPRDWLDVLTYTERDGEYEPIWRCKMGP